MPIHADSPSPNMPFRGQMVSSSRAHFGLAGLVVGGLFLAVAWFNRTAGVTLGREAAGGHQINWRAIAGVAKGVDPIPPLPKGASVMVTGAAGFIGFHLSQRLAKEYSVRVIGVDCYTDYYSVDYKRARAAELKKAAGVEVYEVTLCDEGRVAELLNQHEITHVVHLAAQAGVRRSLTEPRLYVHHNVDCFVALMEVLRKTRPSVNLVFASSSSVYGLNEQLPFSELHHIEKPANLYGATKVHDEHLAGVYRHLYGIPSVGLRFFTVYGEWGRPDMALYGFVDRIRQGKALRLFNRGDMERDFTHVSDVVDGIIRSMRFCKSPLHQKMGGRAEMFNLGATRPIHLKRFIAAIEKALGTEAKIEDAGESRGDIVKTWADASKAVALLNYSPRMSVEEGIRLFVTWYRDHAKPEWGVLPDYSKEKDIKRSQ
eukprot:TRINITY_DN761_c0_g1_i1.p1 TRINITY_DN761_c0_g1~~TRINITY_DN761_c0_g1_i1.p1  ORF type:complete len:429 (+),score=133.13 TRINITY_DN761_c0_g1_i1:208-1494(+)